MKTYNRFSLLCLSLFLAVTGLATFGSVAPSLAPRAAHAQDLESKKIVPFVPTPQEVVDKMIELVGEVPFVREDDDRASRCQSRRRGLRLGVR